MDVYASALAFLEDMGYADVHLTKLERLARLAESRTKEECALRALPAVLVDAVGAMAAVECVLANGCARTATSWENGESVKSVRVGDTQIVLDESLSPSAREIDFCRRVRESARETLARWRAVKW